MSKETVDVPIKDILIDEAVYPRIQYAWQTAYNYSQSMKAGAVFPAIVLGRYRGKLYLVDGRHRMEAFKTLKRDTVPSVIEDFSNKKALFVAAVNANNRHGKALTFDDKAKIFGISRNYRFSDADIEKLINVPVDSFNTLASRLPSFEGKSKGGSNQVYPRVVAKALQKDQITEEEAYSIIRSTPRKDLTSQSVLHALTELVTMFENNLVPLDNQKVHDKCVRLSDLLQSKLVKPEVAAA